MAIFGFTFCSILVLCFANVLDAADLKHVEKINDQKEFKKLLRVRTNVLFIFIDSSSSAASLKTALNVMSEAASQAVGQGTIAIVDCHAAEGKKLCKKLKVLPEPFIIKHYHNGEFHKDYDRQLTAKSVFRFLTDPTGDAPWDEDPTANNVVHLESKSALRKTIALGKRTLVMFYAPWCGHCKALKPHFSAAANELNGEVVLAGMDLTQPGNDEVARIYKIEGYPTIEYFEGGKHKFRYSGENSKDGIISWLKDPTEKPVMREPAEEETPWSEIKSEVVHLTDENFNSFVAGKKSVLVMFYAPWCGHCKKAKPEYMKAAERLKNDGIDGVLAAVDATVHRQVAEKNKVEGFPTFVYYKDGKAAWNVNERTEDGFYKFMKNPVEPPPPELPWSSQPGSVLHLDAAAFKTELKKKKGALVMFYAPWCGHCKKAKPFFSEAADILSNDSRVAFAAVDCTVETSLCQEYGVKGYPTIIFLSYGKNRVDYNGAHDAKSFADFVLGGGQAKPKITETPPPPPSQSFGFSDTVTVLTTENFYETVAVGKILVMFFSPWCNHCKVAKPAFNEASQKAEGGKFAAVDCTVEQEICNQNDIRGYPTFKIFIDGVSKVYNGGRTASDFAAFFEEVDTSRKTEL